MLSSKLFSLSSVLRNNNSFEQQLYNGMYYKQFSCIKKRHKFYSSYVLCNMMHKESVMSHPLMFLRYIHCAREKYKENYYDILGITKNASQKEIKEAYIELAQKYHPDKNGNTRDVNGKFREVNKAYEVLSDDLKRFKYDQENTEICKNSALCENKETKDEHTKIMEDILYGIIIRRGEFETKRFEYKFNVDFNFHFGGLINILKLLVETIAGWFGRGKSRFSIESQRRTMRVTFLEAIHGVEKDVNVFLIEICKKCDGSGIADEFCRHCDGKGIHVINEKPFTTRPCLYCNTTGRQTCPKCKGRKTIIEGKKVRVYVAPGLENNDVMHITIGDQIVSVIIKVDKSDYFTRDGYDIYTDAKISPLLALFGGSIYIKGLYENHKINIVPRTLSGAMIKLEGKGIKKMTEDGHGDHYVTVRIKLFFCRNY